MGTSVGVAVGAGASVVVAGCTVAPAPEHAVTSNVNPSRREIKNQVPTVDFVSCIGASGWQGLWALGSPH